MKRTKIIKYGWIPKWGSVLGCIDMCENTIDILAVDKRGAKRDWEPEDWPPKKIRITVEEV